jgi:formate--tetrahydrofolate ligase
MHKFGLPVVVALNRFTSDTSAEIAAVQTAMARLDTEAVLCTHWAEGGKGALGLARAVKSRLDRGAARFSPLYPDAMPLAEKLKTIAREIYRAGEVTIPLTVAQRFSRWEAEGFGHLPVCVAKTQYSFSADPTALGAPTGHVLPVRDVRLSAGAGFVVAICGEIMTMPGLPRHPAAETIGLDGAGNIEGLS